MNDFQEYALLVVVAAPVVAIFAANVMAMLAGERGTLLLPEIGRFPSAAADATIGAAPMAAAAPAEADAANDAMAERAA